MDEGGSTLLNGFPSWPDIPADQLERELLDTWRRERLFEQTQEQTRTGLPFVFFEGPPTANGLPGIHHVPPRTIKDLVCRFRAMQGRQVTRKGGWDTHGLPVEIEVEKRLQLKGKKDIEDFGVEKFNALCRESVFTYRDEWVAFSDRIGYWLDWDDAYITCSNQYIESVWALLKRLWEKGLLTRGHRVLPYCPRCGTVLSSHELALGYEDVRDKAIYVTFPLDDGTGRELVVWTTTPWTLPSNVAVAVNPDLEYGTFDVGGRRLVIAVERAEPVLKNAEKAVETFPGSRLIGLRYRRPLDVVPWPEDSQHPMVTGGDFVTAEDGSGIVHLAPAVGADDYAVGQREGLAFLNPVAADGTFQGTTWPELEGRLVTADETNDLIIRKLKADGRHLRTDQHQHSYPHCWRCQSKLIYYARASWFVRTSAVKDRLLALNREIAWQPPEVGTGRFGEWLENNVDWALSRDRYWGTPLPVWVADDDPDHVEVIGSFAELAARVGRPLPPDFDPHKPFIDQYAWPSPGGGTMRRTREVIDAWFDSGSMPYAQWHWPFENQEQFERHFPADFICEGIDQTRGWFYSLLAIGATGFDQAAYRNVVVNELILDAQGQKMAKSRGNTVDPNSAIAEFGADTIRLYLLAASEVWKPKRFDRRTIPDVAGGFLNTLRNTYSFFALYAGGRPDGLTDRRTDGPTDLQPLDLWVRSQLQATVNDVVDAWESYQVTAGVKAIMRFVVDDLSNWYVRLSRGRFWAPDREADPAAVDTLREALLTVSRLLAPAAPFASDWLHRSLTGTSVHLASFPSVGAAGQDTLRSAMDAVRTLASLARAARDEASLRVRQPLARMRVAVPSAVRGPGLDGLLELLAQEVNVKAVEIVGSDAELVQLSGRPNFRSLGKRYGPQTPAAAAAVAKLETAELRRLEAGEAVTLFDGEASWVYQPEDVAVERRVASDWLVATDGPFVAALDPALTPVLRREGLARELVNRIQRLRKDAGYEYTTRIQVAIDGGDAVRDAATVYREFLMGETLARDLSVGPPSFGPDRLDEFVIDDHGAVIAVIRHDPGVHH
ncbi:MAG TPA: isoleucine--tRNA ligase [Gemmatimonadales bacterium]